jgi:hypothetical protein
MGTYRFLIRQVLQLQRQQIGASVLTLLIHPSFLAGVRVDLSRLASSRVAARCLLRVAAMRDELLLADPCHQKKHKTGLSSGHFALSLTSQTRLLESWFGAVLRLARVGQIQHRGSLTRKRPPHIFIFAQCANVRKRLPGQTSSPDTNRFSSRYFRPFNELHSDPATV